jgi:hypothetical protein
MSLKMTMVYSKEDVGVLLFLYECFLLKLVYLGSYRVIESRGSIGRIVEWYIGMEEKHG